MRKQIIPAISLHFLLATGSVSSASNLMATPVPGNERLVLSPFRTDSTAQLQPEIKYLGHNEDYYFFEVLVNNPFGSKVSIVLTDKFTRNTLFSDNFYATSYTKKVAVPKDSIELQWDFTNKSIKGKTSQRTLSLGTSVKFKDEVKLTRL